MLDTCVVIDMLLDFDDLDAGVRSFIEAPENELCASFETMREIVVLFNNKRLLSKRWKKAEDVLRYIEDELEIDFLPLRPEVGYTYARLQLNEEQEQLEADEQAAKDKNAGKKSTSQSGTDYSAINAERKAANAKLRFDDWDK